MEGKSGTLALVRQSYGGTAIAGRYEGTTGGELLCSDMMGPGAMPMPMPIPSTEMAIHGPMTLSITVAGTEASGVATVRGRGTATQSGQTVRILGRRALRPSKRPRSILRCSRSTAHWLAGKRSRPGCEWGWA